MSAPGGATSPDVSANGRIVTYSRNGVVYVNKDGHTRKIAAGTDPSSDSGAASWRSCAAAALWTANISGATHVHRIATKIHRQDHLKAMAGDRAVDDGRRELRVLREQRSSTPTCTSASPAAPAAWPTQVAGSPHGNYAVYSCNTGALYMSYVGGR